jgi:hypothetical protein
VARTEDAAIPATTDQHLEEHHPQLYAKIRRYVEDTDRGCWLWLGGRNGAGHPVMAWEGRAVALRRLILSMLHPLGWDGAQTTLICASPRCVRPNHIAVTSHLTADQAFAAFWSQVDRTGACWTWQGAYRSDGRAVFYWAGKVHHPARWAYTFAYGSDAIPLNHRVVPTCPSAACLRLSHLAVLEYHAAVQRARARVTPTHKGLPAHLWPLEAQVAQWINGQAPPLPQLAAPAAHGGPL